MRKPKLPLDSEVEISVRERMKPNDESVVLAKMGDGALVEVKTLKTPLFKDGVMVRDMRGNPIATHYHPWAEPVDETVRKFLKVGIAEQFVFKWENAKERTMGVAIGRDRWVPVKKSDKEVIVPFAYGDQTDGYYHMGDTILCKRPREYAERLSRERAIYDNPMRVIQNKEEEMSEKMRSAGMKDVDYGLEEDPDSEPIKFSEAVQ